jgi:hypothetical protein
MPCMVPERCNARCLGKPTGKGRVDVETASLSDLFDRLIGAQPAPPWWLVFSCACLALVTVAYRPTWRVARNVVTIAHEGGHAFAALATGRQLQGIRLHSDTSGLTLSRGKPTGLGMILTLLAGYITPPLLGFVGALFLAAGHITALLWVTILLLLGMLVMIRNLYGAASVIVTGGVIFLVSWFASPVVQGAFAYVAVWFLLLSGTRPVIELQSMRRRGQAPESDADQLARLTGLPGLGWVVFFVVIAVFALLLGGLLLMPVERVPLLGIWVLR